MTKWLGWIGATVGGIALGSVGARIGVLAGFLLGVVGTGAGLYAGRRLGARYE